MGNWRKMLEEAITSDATLPLPIDLGLRALTPVQRAGMGVRHLSPKVSVPAHVVSFGNITAGGTGKTPAVIERAAQAVAEGRKVALVTRGYGSEKMPEPLVEEGAWTNCDIARKMGDEAALLKRRVPTVLLVKSANRVAGAKEAVQRGCDYILLDDGFQSVSLERTEDIVLLDAARPLGNGHLIPRGTLRESPSALARATEVWLTRCDHAPDIQAAIALVNQYHHRPPARLTVHAPVGLWRLSDSEWMPLEFLRGQQVTVACGIAHPQQFVRTLESLGARVQAVRAFPDHHRFTSEDLPQNGVVVVTEKDAVKLSHAHPGVYALAMELRDWEGGAAQYSRDTRRSGDWRSGIPM